MGFIGTTAEIEDAIDDGIITEGMLVYNLDDEAVGSITAGQIVYNNTGTSLSATTVQEAISELDSDLNNSTIVDLSSEVTTLGCNVLYLECVKRSGFYFIRGRIQSTDASIFPEIHGLPIGLNFSSAINPNIEGSGRFTNPTNIIAIPVWFNTNTGVLNVGYTPVGDIAAFTIQYPA